MRQKTKKDVLAAGQRGSEYDAACKRLFQNKEILAPILKIIILLHIDLEIQKVYSIWICNQNIPKKLRNTITEYSITKRDILGQTNEPEKDYDLMSVIMIRRSDNEKENTDNALLDYLDAVFEANRI